MKGKALNLAIVPVGSANIALWAQGRTSILESVLLLCGVAVTKNRGYYTEVEGVTTASLNLVHNSIGSAEERVTADSVNRVPADPDARGDVDS
jgi:hypothetical protein